MQEEVEMRAVTLAISTSKLSGRLLKAAIAKVLKEASKPKDKPPTVKHGKQSLKELMATTNFSLKWIQKTGTKSLNDGFCTCFLVHF